MYENMMNKPDDGDSLLFAIYENTVVLNANPLEVNKPKPNLVILSDSYVHGDGSIEREAMNPSMPILLEMLTDFLKKVERSTLTTLI